MLQNILASTWLFICRREVDLVAGFLHHKHSRSKGTSTFFFCLADNRFIILRSKSLSFFDAR